MPKPKPLTPTQEKVLRMVGRAPNQSRQIAGNGMAPYTSAARALVRKGLLMRGAYGYFLVGPGRPIAEELIKRYDEQKKEKAE